MNKRQDFPMLEGDLIYFDNGATSLKPYQVIEAMDDYYYNYTANAHRGDYDNSLKVDLIYDETRALVKDFIHANSTREIVFNSGATEGLNTIVFGYMRYYLKKGDEVILSKSEHASNLLPWFALKEELDIVIKYVPLDEDKNVKIKNLEAIITPKTKVISLAHITNVIGDVRPIKQICRQAHKRDILVVVDAAQSVGHIKVDVTDLDCDFLVFSAHKMLGPTGIGVTYGKYDLLNKVRPSKFGGGMNATFDSQGNFALKELPTKLEAGTQNIAGIIGLNAALKYLNEIGLENIEKYVEDLHEYLINKLSSLDNIIIFNKYSKNGIITFNIKNVFSQDTSVYLNKSGICVRSGNHCAKILQDILKVNNTCRISLYFYNTTEEIDILYEVLKENRVYDNII